jgi:F0F1-type ATP synthase assembly protein I
MKKGLVLTEKEKIKQKQMEVLGKAMRLGTNLGLMIVLPMMGGLFLGLFLDNAWGTKPFLTLILLTVGLIFGSLAVFWRMKDL